MQVKNRSKDGRISHTAQLALLTSTRVMKVESIRGVKSHSAALKWRRLQLAL